MDVEQLFKSLKKEAECPLCLETIKNPKTLPCLHSFCLECLDELANFAKRQLQTTIRCPVCQTSFPIPDTDTFANLPSSFHLNRLVDVLALEDGTVQTQRCNTCDKTNPATSYCFVCQSFLCASCFQYHQLFKATRGHRNVLMDNLQAQDVQKLIQRPVMCSEQYHDDQPLEFYCEDCKVLVCHKCSVVTHNRHSMTDIQKAAKEQKLQMAEVVAKVKAEILLYEHQITKQTELKNQSEADIINAEKKMTASVEELIRDLREHEKKMKDKFRDIYKAEQKQHAARLENLELVNTQLKSFVERGQGILQRNISAEILQTNPTIIGRGEELLNTRKANVYNSPYLHYFVDKKFILLDQILVTRTDPLMCLAEYHDSETGKESSFVVVTRDSKGLQCYQHDDQIKVVILTPEGDHLRTELKDSKDGKYIVTYTPQSVGKYSVEIQVNAQLLTGRPCVVQVRDHEPCVVQVRDHEHQYQFAFKFGSRGKREGEFHFIRDIAVSDKTGTIAVADYLNKRIQLFSPGGKFQKEIRLAGNPISLAFTGSGDLLTLLSESNNKLYLFSEEGEFIKYINNNHLKKPPRQLSIASDGRLIITNKVNNKIKVLTSDGNDLLLSFVAPNCDKYPKCAVYYLDKFYVSYPEAHCVKVFDKRGVFLHDIGCKGSNDGRFNYPVGLVIDKYNQLVVCDGNNGRLQFFTLRGKFLSKLFICGDPRYVTINNNDNNLLFTDFENVHVFH
ncbi:PREDICTED: E3 ubiquitin-protein ligase TRIM71-like [Acropora digitifera]|uniref:E3 ubiquitin-protein ligase TRIM71-like n=1 Tax=Acropora digitifera TaxID=70779 RepID=UPI00077AC5A6|nr:PREDICTED: E3 ubiquitin-protein ligase TRIM71-like [Acropora digitifera]